MCARQHSYGRLLLCCGCAQRHTGRWCAPPKHTHTRTVRHWPVLPQEKMTDRVKLGERVDAPLKVCVGGEGAHG